MEYKTARYVHVATTGPHTRSTKSRHGIHKGPRFDHPALNTNWRPNITKEPSLIKLKEGSEQARPDKGTSSHDRLLIAGHLTRSARVRRLVRWTPTPACFTASWNWGSPIKITSAISANGWLAEYRQNKQKYSIPQLQRPPSSTPKG